MPDQTKNQAVAARFSAAATTYHASAKVQRAVARRLSAMLGGVGAVERILEIGCGTGLLTAHLCRLFPQARIDALDVSGGMVAQCRLRLADESRLHLHVSDPDAFRAGAPYPLIVSSSALHWIYPIAGVVRILAGMLSANGRLAIALMVRGTLAELQAARRRVAPDKLPARQLPTVDSVRAALEREGLRIEEELEENQREEYSSAVEFLRVLHDQGLTGGPFAHSGRMLTRNELRRLALDYESNYRQANGVYASYQVAYFHVRKAGGQAHL